MNNNNRGNNNNNNNRRRGRGNNNRPGGGGGQQVNRIDSRARGNAPQLLEKYRKLALDSHMNGDRVTEEYYLQFADHYFRVIADTRVRQEETRVRRDQPWQENGGGDTDRSEYAEYVSDEPNDGYDDVRAAANANAHANNGGDRYDRQDRGGDRNNGDRSNGERGNERSADRPERQDRNDRQDRGERQDRAPRNDRFERAPRNDAADTRTSEPRNYEQRQPEQRQPEQREPAAANPADTDEQRNPYEPVENPFVRDGREPRGLKPRRARRPREDQAELNISESSEPAAPASAPVDATPVRNAEPESTFDASILPPAVVRRSADPVETVGEADAPPVAADVDAEIKPRRRVRRPRPPVDGSDETLQAVS